jgi:hypothetical protein
LISQPRFVRLSFRPERADAFESRSFLNASAGAVEVLCAIARFSGDESLFDRTDEHPRPNGTVVWFCSLKAAQERD